MTTEQSTGLIVKGIGGFYYVQSPQGLATCRAKGAFRRMKISPQVGDRVRFHGGLDGTTGMVDEILPRSNITLRPPIANVNQLIIVASAQSPAVDLYLVDRLFIHAHIHDMQAVFVLNKCDITADSDIQALLEQYGSMASACIAVSASTGYGIEALRSCLAGHISCLAGQSGVGKSSLINALIPGKGLETGDISEKTGRGRHTTRHVELIAFGNGGSIGFLADTPGFSMLEMEDMEPASLKTHYPEFTEYAAQCRFNGCQHDNEPGCAVEEAARQGGLSPLRYERYRHHLHDLQERWKHRYD